MRSKRFVNFLIIVQSLLFLVHLFLYETWTFSSHRGVVAGAFAAELVFSILSISFLTASLLAFRYANPAVRVLYKVAAVWAGLLTFLLIAAAASWIAFGAARLAGVELDFHRIVEVLFGIAVVIGLSGVFNASLTRITRITVRIANLPAVWRGRKAALVSDLHLGHVRAGSFLRRTVAKIMREQPDVIFIAGDLYDGTAIDARKAAEPLKQLAAPHGLYFVAGNHDEFRTDGNFVEAVAAAGVRVLSDEKVDIEGLQIVGVPYGNAVHRSRFASVLHAIGLDRGRASILLTHAPDHLDVAEAAGVSLQLSGHTHLGQFVPWSWIARRVYRQFVYGLSRIGNMQVFTSSGAGTWGPPLRLGSKPEIVVLELQ